MITLPNDRVTDERLEVRRQIGQRLRLFLSPPTYNYVPLQYADSIRLLTLFPGEMESAIEISLTEARFQDNPIYEAVSYTWATEDGDSSLRSQIRCDEERVWVTKNCELALKYLRKADSERVLWVDAICINQKDVKERGHQVGIMHDVYSNATEVVVWLGVASEDLDTPTSSSSGELELSDWDSATSLEIAHETALDSSPVANEISNSTNPAPVFSTPRSVSEIFLEFLGRMSAEIRLLRSTGGDTVSSPLYQEFGQLMSNCYQTGVASGIIRGFLHTVHRRWWSRVWVIQEAALDWSATMVCSKQSVNYNDFLGKW